MNAQERREKILRTLSGSAGPVSAGSLASQLEVSRQIIVGDVALLRAGGADIYATPRGYILTREDASLIRTVACNHTQEQTEDELNIMVDNGCVVKDVIIEHRIYGQISGSLDLRSRYDVKQFMSLCGGSDALPLSILTSGVHLHTLLCPDEEAYKRVLKELAGIGVLYEEN